MKDLISFVVASVAAIPRSNALSVFGDLGLPDHLARPKSDSEGGGFARRLQLAVKGKLVDILGVPPGHYAVVDGDNITQLGKEVDVIPIAVLDKAVDTSGDDIVIAFGAETDAYKAISKKKADRGFDSGCMTGPVFLLFERSTGQFYELYCNNASMVREASTIFDALPVNKEQAKRHGIKPRPPQPLCLTSKYLSKGKYPRQVPVFKKSDAQFDTLPTAEALQAAVTGFIKQAVVEADDHAR